MTHFCVKFSGTCFNIAKSLDAKVYRILDFTKHFPQVKSDLKKRRTLHSFRTKWNPVTCNTILYGSFDGASATQANLFQLAEDNETSGWLQSKLMEQPLVTPVTELNTIARQPIKIGDISKQHHS